MYDSFNRKINYLRISVTDRCNLRCVYCMPQEGVPLIGDSDILSFEEIAAITRACVARGVDKVRITGGEPLLRKGIVRLISMIAAIDNILDIAMTTNGIVLTEFAEKLAQAGLGRVNVSLDTLDPDRYREITRRGDLRDVLRGIEAARKAGLEPIKLNCLICESKDEKDARAVGDYGRKNNLEVRYIRRMNRLEGRFWPVEGGSGGDCPNCNRLRLTSDGRIFPCLFSDTSVHVKELGIARAIQQALEVKPESGLRTTDGRFNMIGG